MDNDNDNDNVTDEKDREIDADLVSLKSFSLYNLSLIAYVVDHKKIFLNKR
jgi:hypothetical protein